MRLEFVRVHSPRLAAGKFIWIDTILTTACNIRVLKGRNFPPALPNEALMAIDIGRGDRLTLPQLTGLFS
jgi:hypothetical protein